MNIFWLDEDMQTCAEYHCDKHVVKMFLESVQILSTALHLAGVDNVPYKPTHSEHPCVVWAASSNDNFKKLSLLSTKLSNEYTHRYGKRHKSADALVEIFKLTNMNTELPFENVPESSPPLCMPEDLVDTTQTTVQSYRSYYIERLNQFGKMSYTDREIPEFLL